MGIQRDGVREITAIVGTLLLGVSSDDGTDIPWILSAGHSLPSYKYISFFLKLNCLTFKAGLKRLSP